MKFFFIVGEKSADNHAAELIAALKKGDPDIEIQGWGGEKMQAAGAKILKHYSELAYMGFVEIIKHLPEIFRNLDLVKQQILTFKPDQVVLVDYAGFNLKIAKWAHQNKIKVNYYIPPKTWAWNEKRNASLKKYVDRLFVIFPFEKKYFERLGIKTYYCGNPSYEQVNAFKSTKNTSEKYIALLPGSRQQEIKNMLGIMSKVAHSFPGLKFKVAAINDFPIDFYKQLAPNLEIVFDATYELLSQAHAAVVTSGTATLETALFKVPQVVVYKTNPITYYIAKLFVKLKYISLANILAEKKIVEELIQGDFDEKTLESELNKIIFDTKIREKQFLEYSNLIANMQHENASEAIAKILKKNEK
jgi:lipid-A-disaccharide synthase